MDCRRPRSDLAGYPLLSSSRCARRTRKKSQDSHHPDSNKRPPSQKNNPSQAGQVRRHSRKPWLEGFWPKSTVHRTNAPEQQPVTWIDGRTWSFGGYIRQAYGGVAGRGGAFTSSAGPGSDCWGSPTCSFTLGSRRNAKPFAWQSNLLSDTVCAKDPPASALLEPARWTGPHISHSTALPAEQIRHIQPCLRAYELIDSLAPTIQPATYSTSKMPPTATTNKNKTNNSRHHLPLTSILFPISPPSHTPNTPPSSSRSTPTLTALPRLPPQSQPQPQPSQSPWHRLIARIKSPFRRRRSANTLRKRVSKLNISAPTGFRHLATGGVQGRRRSDTGLWRDGEGEGDGEGDESEWEDVAETAGFTRAA
ncbi:hypothetical protein P153DRAFT_433051 [Dothidotthia symphoricarpi CBS 119687]|uniref:Uncharacterized protein n=1 Tax=Dothidotthia symphoricarpi CBS 119687 TaxID=1392245 RepID=A0A6A6A9A9_9PLEO|nr:uncharacterized protein P153DRAFT_433051 [Dothidotthia symphoricarpi CBS 119687]KAF2127241.1 hypothetical protein P153DRAFT_433051 [Dothidotthia symphoricarpi CBS 119687]